MTKSTALVSYKRRRLNAVPVSRLPLAVRRLANRGGVVKLSRAQELQVKAAAALAGNYGKLAGHAAGYVARRAYNAYNRSKVKKTEGKDHPVQQYGAIDSDNITLGKFGKMPTVYSKAKYQLMYNYSGVVGSPTGNVGVQVPEVVCGLMNYSQLTTSTGITYNRYQAPIGLFNAIPNDLPASNGTTNTNSYFYGKTPGTVVSHSKVYVQNISVQLTLANHMTNGCIADVYLLESKLDGSNSPTDIWTYGGEIFSPTIWNQQSASSGATNATTGYPTMSYWGIRPQSSQQFRNHFKILAVKSYDIAAGGNSQLLNINFRIGKTFDRNKIVLTNTSVLKGTKYIMIVGRGMQCLKTDAAVTGTGQDSVLPTYSPVYLSYIAKVCISYRCLADKIQASDIHLGTSTILNVPLDANVKSINTGTGSSAAITAVS